MVTLTYVRPCKWRMNCVDNELPSTHNWSVKETTQSSPCIPRENSVECHAPVFHWTLCVLCMHGSKFEVLCSFLYALFPRLTSSSRSIHSFIHLINAFQGPVPIIRPYPKRLSGCRSIPTRELLVSMRGTAQSFALHHPLLHNFG